MPDFYGKTISSAKVDRIVAAYQPHPADRTDSDGDPIPALTTAEVEQLILDKTLRDVRERVLRHEKRAARAVADAAVNFEYD